MSDANIRVQPEAETGKGIVTGSVVYSINSHKEAAMENKTNTLTVTTLTSGLKVYTTPSGKKQFTITYINFPGAVVEVHNFGVIKNGLFELDGFKTLNLLDEKGEVVLTANKTEYGKWHNFDLEGKTIKLQAFNEYNGFLSALVSLKTAKPESTYRPGIHRAGGIEALRTVWEWDDFNMEPLYIRWSFVTKADKKWLEEEYGIEKPADKKFHNTWLAYKPSRKLSVINFYRVMPEEWDAWNEKMDEKGISYEEDYATWRKLRNYNEKDWNVIAKHDGLEVALMLLAGDQYIYLHDFTYNEAKGTRLEAKFEGLVSKDAATLRTEQAEKKVKYDAARRVINNASKVNSNEEYEFNDEAKDVTALVIWSHEAGKAITVAATELVGKTVEFVSEDGTPSDIFVPVTLFNLALVQPTVDMAANYDNLIAVVAA